MANRGRYGKYGEHKRMERLRLSAKQAPGPAARPDPGGRGTAPGRKPAFPGTVLKTRVSGPSDARLIRSLSRAFRVYGPYEDLLSEWLQSGAALTFIGMRDNRPAGFAMLGRVSSAWHFPGWCELLAIVVDPSSRRRGLAGLMLRTAEEQAARLGAERLVLHTAVDNAAAQGLFRKHGYSPLHTQQTFYPEGQDAVCMVKELGPAPDPPPSV